jgi:hypothetical protein
MAFNRKLRQSWERHVNASTLLIIALAGWTLLHGMSCTPPPAPDKLDELGTVDINIQGTNFRLWIADDYAEHANGLMLVSAERLARLPDGTERGMIFVFDHSRELSFWMKNTIIPLDIAYLESDGTVVKTYTMAPLDERVGQYSSGRPAQYAIEVNAGVWSAIGLKPGDRVAIPASLLNRTP